MLHGQPPSALSGTQVRATHANSRHAVHVVVYFAGRAGWEPLRAQHKYGAFQVHTLAQRPTSCRLCMCTHLTMHVTRAIHVPLFIAAPCTPCRYFKKPKFIITLRDPVARAMSAWIMVQLNPFFHDPSTKRWHGLPTLREEVRDFNLYRRSALAQQGSTYAGERGHAGSKRAWGGVYQ